MKFPLLIKVGNNRTCHVIDSWEELPKGISFRIVKTGTDIEAITIETDYRRVDEPEESNEEAPEDSQSLDDDSKNDSASKVG